VPVTRRQVALPRAVFARIVPAFDDVLLKSAYQSPVLWLLLRPAAAGPAGTNHLGWFAENALIVVAVFGVVALVVSYKIAKKMSKMAIQFVAFVVAFLVALYFGLIHL
jgi:Zn-dependent protease with chaperone function